VNIFLTFDYELFFGSSTGSVEKCLLSPTNRLLELSRKYGVKMTFFVDVGYLIKAREFSSDSAALMKDVVAVETQLKEIVATGNDVQLHIHPHWERSVYKNDQWHIQTDGAYKLSDFSADEKRRIVLDYKKYLDELIGYKTKAFRAGGWCIQPFNELEIIFKEAEIKYDSSVFPGGKFSSTHYAFDFTKAPKKCSYRFQSDVCQEDANGDFVEYPISSMNYSPFFYWRLYMLGRLFPEQHKMLGDGDFLAQPGRKRSVLTNFTWNHVSSDGYYVSKLKKYLNRSLKKRDKQMVSIGHPKSMTNYSFRKLANFIEEHHKKHNFETFNNLP
jgi:hypothetical protein